jgi:hypothetical protein
LIACPIRGKSGGTRALCQGSWGYLTTYTFTAHPTQWTAQLAVCRSGARLDDLAEPGLSFRLAGFEFRAAEYLDAFALVVY